MLPPQRNEIPPPKKLPILVLNFNFHNCASTSSRHSPGFFPGYLFFFLIVFFFPFFSGMWSINLSSSLCFSAPQGRRNSPRNTGHFGCLQVRSGRCCVELHHGLFCGCYRFIYWLLGWFSNRTGALVDDGARKSNNFSPFRLLSCRQLLHRKLDPNWFSETVPRCNSTQHRTVFTRLRLNIIHFSGLKIFRKF